MCAPSPSSTRTIPTASTGPGRRSASATSRPNLGSGLFGGNSNWRGPIWFPVNYLLIESIRKFHKYYGDDFRVECPTGSGNFLNLQEVARELGHRLCNIFLKDATGRRPVFGDNAKMQNDPHFRDHVLFYEYFHGDTRSRCRRLHPDRLDRARRQAALAALYHLHPPEISHAYRPHGRAPAPSCPSCQVRRVLKGQKALVTGASSGIGKAVAVALGQAGADVVVNYVAGLEQASWWPTRSAARVSAPSRIRPT